MYMYNELFAQRKESLGTRLVRIGCPPDLILTSAVLGWENLSAASVRSERSYGGRSGEEVFSVERFGEVRSVKSEGGFSEDEIGSWPLQTTQLLQPIADAAP